MLPIRKGTGILQYPPFVLRGIFHLNPGARIPKAVGSIVITPTLKQILATIYSVTRFDSVMPRLEGVILCANSDRTSLDIAIMAQLIRI